MGAAILDAVYGSTPVPLQVSGLILWLKADAGTFQNTALTSPAVANADPIGGWQDQSGTGNHVTQATASKRPTLRLAVQNGLPVVRFDGVDDVLANVLSYPTSTLLVAYAARSGTNGTFLGTTAAPNSPIHRDTAVWYNGGVASIALSGGTLNTRRLLTCLFNYSGSSFSVRLNGAAAGSSVTAAGVPSGTLEVGTRADTEYLNGDVCEIALYNRILTSSEYGAAEGYLQSRWTLY